MRKVWVVIRREFLERVRSRWFVIGTLLGPVMMLAIIVLPIMLVDTGARPRSVVVVDGAGGDLGARLSNLLAQSGSQAQAITAGAGALSRIADSLVHRVQLEAIDGVVILPPEAVDSGVVEYRGSNTLSTGDMQLLHALARQAVVAERLRRHGVDPDAVAQADRMVRLRTVTIRGNRADESGQATFFLAYMVWFLLYISIVLYGVQVMGSVVEEKSTRMVEVLVSSVDPFQLLTGKIVGVGAVGLLQMAIWSVFGKLILDRRLELATLADASGETARALAELSLPAVPAGMVVVSLLYFLLGFFLYAAMFAAVAAMVNTEAEARQAQIPVIMLLMVPTVLMVGILAEPDGNLAKVLGMVPVTAPIAMPVRYAATPIPAVELASSLLLLAGTVLGVVWVAGRIYRVGILMYGKKPGLREIVRWVAG
jgi:ABC-2 type transport system permease protein